MLSLYAHAFGSYGTSLLPAALRGIGLHVLISGAVVVLTVLNAAGSRLVGDAEEWIVGFNLTILLLFVGGGLWSIDASRLAPEAGTGVPELIAGGMIIFLAYEGFELIANTAADVRDAPRNLPRFLERKVWRRPLEGLLITSGLALVVANLFDLGSISMMGSAGFLLVFAAVNVAGLRLRSQTGGGIWLPVFGTLGCLGALAVLVRQRERTALVRLGRNVLRERCQISSCTPSLHRFMNNPD